MSLTINQYFRRHHCLFVKTSSAISIFQIYNKMIKLLKICRQNMSNELKDKFSSILGNNQKWSKDCLSSNPMFFKKLVNIHKPDYLWVGCSDARVPANEIVGLKPGQLFVTRNIANQVPPSDINSLAVIQYSVQELKVKDIIVTGHYNCGGIKAAFKKHNHGSLQAWLSHIRDLRARNHLLLNDKDEQVNYNRLTELNVLQQVMNVAKIPVVQQAWKDGQELRIRGLVYNLHDGLLKDLGLTISKITDVPLEFRLIDNSNDI